MEIAILHKGDKRNILPELSEMLAMLPMHLDFSSTKLFHFPNYIIEKKGIFAKSKYQMWSMHHNRKYYVEESLCTCLPRTWQEKKTESLFSDINILIKHS